VHKRDTLAVGFQGELGAYSEKAIDTLFAEQPVNKAPFRTSYDVVDSLKKKEIEFGLFPIENSIVGSITHNYDLLMEHKLHIQKEVIIRIKHSLLALNGVKLSDINRIYSHPAALAQCEVFLRKFEHAEILPTYDTAGSARMIKDKVMTDAAAIASTESAAMYGLQVLEESIEDYPHNQTRFILVASEEIKDHTADSFLQYKTSAVFDTLDQPGMLYKCLGIFEEHEVNLTQLSSRPHKSEPWKYHFFIDLEGHFNDENVNAAFDEIKGLTGFIHMFGSYPKFEGDVSAGRKRVKNGRKKKLLFGLSTAFLP